MYTIFSERAQLEELQVDRMITSVAFLVTDNEMDNFSAFLGHVCVGRGGHDYQLSTEYFTLIIIIIIIIIIIAIIIQKQAEKKLK
jgi:hypothetical protein